MAENTEKLWDSEEGSSEETEIDLSSPSENVYSKKDDDDLSGLKNFIYGDKPLTENGEPIFTDNAGGRYYYPDGGTNAAIIGKDSQTYHY